MSSQCGIFYFDGKEADRNDLRAFAVHLDRHAPDGGGQVCMGSVGMAFCAFHTTEIAAWEAQPVLSNYGHLITWDGRLDNRKEIWSELNSGIHGGIGNGMDRLQPNSATADLASCDGAAQTFGCMGDASLVLAAYRRWGEDVFARLIGDFALALWDPEIASLFLVRDFAGTRPLRYHLDQKRIVWSSELVSLVDRADFNLKVNDQFVAEYLVSDPSAELSPYKGILCVPPGCVLTARRGGNVNIHRFWTLNRREIKYRRDDEYEAHFRALFSEAVRCRLNSTSAVWCELSGGLDSTSILCVADTLINELQNAHGLPETVSYVYDQCKSADERRYIACVERYRGKRSHYIREDDYRALDCPSKAFRPSSPDPAICFAPLVEREYQLIREGGGRVLLTGFAGDSVCWSEFDAAPLDITDLAAKLKFISLHRRIKAWAESERKTYLEMFLRGAIWANLPRQLQVKALPRALRVPKWIDSDLVTRARLRDLYLRPTDIFGFRLPSQRVHSSMIAEAVNSTSGGHSEELGPVEIRYPYLHRPLVEFCLGIPVEQKMRPGEMRSLQRRALHQIVPTEILSRKDKCTPNEAIVRAVVRRRGWLNRLFENSRSAAHGYINGDLLCREIDECAYGGRIATFELLRAISLEIWLRTLDEGEILCSDGLNLDLFSLRT